MKNFIFISPNFPTNYWMFCRHLKDNGLNVLGIGDQPYDELDPNLKNSLNEYYKVSNLETAKKYTAQWHSSFSNTAVSTGSNPTTNTGWNVMQNSVQISILQAVSRHPIFHVLNLNLK